MKPSPKLSPPSWLAGPDFDAVPLKVTSLFKKLRLRKDPRKAAARYRRCVAPARTAVHAGHNARAHGASMALSAVDRTSILGMIAVTLAIPSTSLRSLPANAGYAGPQFLRPRRDLSFNGWPYRLTAAISRSGIASDSGMRLWLRSF